MKKYVTLLRGINISGKNKISMNELKESLKKLNLSNIITYFNSGNIIFETNEKNKTKLMKQVKQHIKDTFALDIPVFIIEIKELEELLNNEPDWWKETNKQKYDNIIFIIELHTYKEIYNVLGEPKKEYEIIKEYKNNIFWSFDLRYYQKTNWWSKTASTSISKYITIRTKNTMKKILGLVNK